MGGAEIFLVHHPQKPTPKHWVHNFLLCYAFSFGNSDIWYATFLTCMKSSSAHETWWADPLDASWQHRIKEELLRAPFQQLSGRMVQCTLNICVNIGRYSLSNARSPIQS